MISNEVGCKDMEAAAIALPWTTMTVYVREKSLAEFLWVSMEDLPPPDGVFSKFLIGNLLGSEQRTAILRMNKSYEIHYLRAEVTMLWQEIDKLPHKHNLAIEGQPGTGKSTAVWRKVVEMAASRQRFVGVTFARWKG